MVISEENYSTPAKVDDEVLVASAPIYDSTEEGYVEEPVTF